MESLVSILEPVDRQAPLAVAEVTVNVANMRAALSNVLERLRAGNGFTLFTVNLDHVV